MSFHEIKSLVTFGAQAVGTAAYAYFISMKHADLAHDANVLKFWATMIILMIPVFIVVHVAAMVVLAVVNKETTGEEFPKFPDERDKMIDLQAIRVEYSAVTASIFTTMLTIYFGSSLSTSFSVLIGGMMAASMFSSATKYYLYNKGS